jgi:hypothetical protein
MNEIASNKNVLNLCNLKCSIPRLPKVGMPNECFLEDY